MVTNFMVKMGEIGSPLSQFRFQKVRLRWSGYIVQNLVNFGSLRGWKAYIPSSISSLATRRHC